MVKPVDAAVGGLVIGTLAGLAIGIAIAYLHVSVPVMLILGVATTPSISGLLLGGVAGTIVGLTVGYVRKGQRSGQGRSQGDA